MKPLPYREVKRKLEAAGFVQVAQTGSHVKFARTTAAGTRTATVPDHREVGERYAAQHLTAGWPDRGRV